MRPRFRSNLTGVLEQGPEDVGSVSAVPRVSIVMAAYGRPEVLAWAIESVQCQSVTDWELLVVCDACPVGSPQLAQTYADTDSRIRVIEMTRNWGEQSGPNNVGLARSSAPLVAFLNQDDLWFPDHLAVLIDWLDAAGADIVLGASAHMNPTPPGDQQSLTNVLAGMGEEGWYCPVRTFSPMSAWLVRRECFGCIGLLPRAQDCMAEMSQTWLFRAWRKQLKIATCPELTCLVFSSGSRPNSYVDSDSTEQAHFSSVLRCNEVLRPQILAHARPGYVPDLNQSKAWWQLHWGKVLAHLGVFPRAVLLRKQHARAGAYIRHLRSVRGLGNPEKADQDHPKQLLERWRNRYCLYEAGNKLTFGVQGQAVRHLTDGWCEPDGDGCRMQVPTVGLRFCVEKHDVQVSRLVTVWQLPEQAVLYASLNAEGIAMLESCDSNEVAGAQQWTWVFPPTPEKTSRRLNFEIHSPVPGCRLLAMWLTA